MQYADRGGLEEPGAHNIFKRAGLDPDSFRQLWTAADLDRNGKLNKLEFCLFMYLTKAVKRGGQIPPSGITLLQVKQ